IFIFIPPYYNVKLYGITYLKCCTRYYQELFIYYYPKSAFFLLFFNIPIYDSFLKNFSIAKSSSFLYNGVGRARWEVSGVL
ncbi:MAG TPA: hypothetical protein DDZ89_00560, partial [Clostridiales bacterium]|nr:hypothetical protein [Clostridiales bacterium]